MILYGLETEYGISRERPRTDYDVVAESIALVQAATQSGVRMRWDYSYEDPHVDARGFRVDALRQDTDEANYFAQDAARPLSFSEIKSDLALKNGARFYNDHAHPEYCTPECRTIADLVEQDQLGDRLVTECAEELSAKTAERDEGRVRLYKNNTDFQGHSYGCHENYLLPRDLAWENVSRGMRAFLATRQIFCGAGKFGWEDEDRYVGPGFQIAQRSDFFSVMESVDTMQKRPLINTRDEPHADPETWRRFHVIVGDANMSPYATYLKVGSTASVLAMLNQVDPARLPQLDDPVGTMREISRDPSWYWDCDLKDGSPTTAIEIQRQYLSLVREVLPEPTDGFQLDDWEQILDDLEKGPETTVDRLDWTAKLDIVSTFRDAENLGEEDPWLISLDLSYHLLDESEGLYYGLRDQGQFRQPPGVTTLSEGQFPPPTDTRARVRGLCIERFGQHVEAAQWDHVRLRDKTAALELDLRRLFTPEAVEEAVAVIEKARRVADLSPLLFAKPFKSV
ncbi:MAG: proteasome accessory factor PafA2 family protein [Verrucomicrobiales bacterium]